MLRLRERRRDDGFGLTEVMISMLIVVILFLALLSVLIQALRVTASNGTKATATQLVTERIERARAMAVSGDCSNMATIVEAVEDTEDGRGVPLQVTGVLENCDQSSVSDPHELPQLARVTVTVTTTQPGYTNPVVSTQTDIFVRFEP